MRSLHLPAGGAPERLLKWRGVWRVHYPLRACPMELYLEAWYAYQANEDEE